MIQLFGIQDPLEEKKILAAVEKAVWTPYRMVIRGLMVSLACAAGGGLVALSGHGGSVYHLSLTIFPVCIVGELIAYMALIRKKRRALKKILLDAGRCHHCGYLLKPQFAARCPECGSTNLCTKGRWIPNGPGARE